MISYSKGGDNSVCLPPARKYTERQLEDLVKILHPTKSSAELLYASFDIEVMPRGAGGHYHLEEGDVVRVGERMFKNCNFLAMAHYTSVVSGSFPEDEEMHF